MHPTPRPVDPDRLQQFLRDVFGAMEGAVTAAMIHLGDRLGLYLALREGPASSVELARRTGLDERWLREWLRQQGASGLLEWDEEERFALSPEAEVVLADEEHLAFGAGMFSQVPALVAVVERLPEAFRTGRGLPYDVLGPEGAIGVERGFAPWYRNLLVPAAIGRLPGIAERLAAGGRAADVGCGGGVALLELARAFPAAELHGYEISEHALARAERNRLEAGADNVHLHHAGKEPLPEDASFDLVMTLDCLHDMTHPAETMRGIRRALRPEGCFLMADPKAHESFAQNVENNPMASMMYGFSVLTCMSSALSAEGGAGLGTLGLHPELARRMAEDAGFSRFERLEVPHPVNAFYVARP